MSLGASYAMLNSNLSSDDILGIQMHEAEAMNRCLKSLDESLEKLRPAEKIGLLVNVLPIFILMI